MTLRFYQYMVAGWAVSATLAAAAPTELPRLFAIGRNVNGEACTAQSNINDPGLYDRAFDRSYALNCGSATASRSVGSVRVVSNSAIARDTVEKTLECAAPQQVMLKGIGKADARMCNDKTLGIRTIALRFTKGSRTYIGNSALSLAGPLENALGIASGAVPVSADSGALIKPSVDAKTLPQLADGQSGSGDDLAFNPRNALQQGIRFNVQGLHVEASRVLNDAISRLVETDATDLRGELELEAGLADSNIGFFESASAHFKRGAELLATDADPVLLRKMGTYRALDELNQRNFPEVVNRLRQIDTGGANSTMPLSDPVIIAALNQGANAQGRASTAVGASSTSALTQVVINAQINWARSAAMLLMNDVTGAESALNQARREFAVIASGGVEQTQTRWLEARIERQAGRIAARKHDWAGSLASFDASLAALRAAQSLGGAGSGPELIETQLERADILARQGGDSANVIREYASAVDAIMESGLSGKIKPSALEPYLALISGGTAGNTDPEAVERYFRAVQSVGEPAIARQVSQLQSVVSADAGLAAQIRERADLAQELTGLRYKIAQRAAGEDMAALEARRKALEDRFSKLDDALASNDRFRITDDRPATVAEIQSILGNDEVYFKLTTAKSRGFGLIIGKRESIAYQLATPVDRIMKTSAAVRQSIDGSVAGSRALRDFRVGAANVLFQMVAGPAPERLASAARIISDPSGPLQRLPIGVLVVDANNAKLFAARGKAAGQNYSQVAFLAERAEISTALSPRSFITVRSFAPSQAPNMFLGLGNHLTPSMAQLDAFGYRRTNFGCLFNTANMTDSYERAHPISREEIVRAASAIGDPGALEITGAEFNDTAVEARTDLNQYEVLHFATHGLQEGQWADCLKAPPALVTSLGTGNSDGLMSFDEIAALKLDANLVFLSACNTEAGVTDEDLARLSGKEEKGASLEGLVRAFLAAKARAVVATYWEASESEGTNRLIETFYTTGRTQSIGAAMRDGQRLLISDAKYSHPFYWAPYFIVGDAGKSMLSPKVASAR
jgi:CHAT domain-containing protein